MAVAVAVHEWEPQDGPVQALSRSSASAASLLTMVALLDALEDKQLVARRPDRHDRRRNVVELTDTGRRVLRRATRASDKAEQQLLTGFDEAGAAQLRALLGRIADRPATTRRSPSAGRRD